MAAMVAVKQHEWRNPKKGKTAMSTQIAKLVARIAENLPEIPSEVMQWWIENPLELQGVLAGLDKRPGPKIDTSKTIKMDIWATIKFDEGTEIDLVKVTVAELGFKQIARRDQIYERAKELGLELCPPKIAPQLRLLYGPEDQINNALIHIGMEPIHPWDGYLSVCGGGCRGSNPWILSDYSIVGSFWGTDLWVFVRPRKY